MLLKLSTFKSEQTSKSIPITPPTPKYPILTNMSYLARATSQIEADYWVAAFSIITVSSTSSLFANAATFSSNEKTAFSTRLSSFVALASIFTIRLPRAFASLPKIFICS
jgi:hypothetical protein